MVKCIPAAPFYIVVAVSRVAWTTLKERDSSVWLSAIRHGVRRLQQVEPDQRQTMLYGIAIAPVAA